MSENSEPPSLHASLDMTLREWIERYQRDVVFNQVHYRGVPSWKNVLDLWVLQEIIWETQIDVVVEIGIRHGGTTLWLSDTLRNLRGEEASVIAIDLEKPAIPFPENVAFIRGDSIAQETLARVTSIARGRPMLVLADGNHAAEHVLQEMRLYAPMIPVGSYFIAEDGIVDVMEWTQYTPGPMAAARTFVDETDEFVIDRSREKFLLTYTPGGFLKRVRPPAQIGRTAK